MISSSAGRSLYNTTTLVYRFHCPDPKDASHAFRVPDDHETPIPPGYLNGSAGDTVIPKVKVARNS